MARAFGVKGAAKSELKLLIKDLESDGAITRGRKVLQRKGALPATVVADIVERDRDGELIARPIDWTRRASRRCARSSSQLPPEARQGAPLRASAPASTATWIDADSEEDHRRGRVVKVLDRARARARRLSRAGERRRTR